jgi:nitroimidazol reductase NimA-like FMN-containing flavoprotein (pyridoxamine 5'-phosphate oxidase superfamily)
MTTINQIRYARRAQDETWVRQFLHKTPFGMLATEFEGQPFLKPSLFVYDESRNAIYIHGALEGRMRTNLEANPRVCFCVAEMGRLLPADTAMEFGVEYASAVVFGTVTVCSDEEEARYGLQLVLDRYFPHMKSGQDYREIIPEELNITAVYRINIQAMSGKETHEPAEFPGAFTYPHTS